MSYKVGVIRGDGIGPEIVAEAKKVLDKVCEKYGHTFSYSENITKRLITQISFLAVHPLMQQESLLQKKH